MKVTIVHTNNKKQLLVSTKTMEKFCNVSQKMTADLLLPISANT